jgi:hypothetical protein
MVPVAVAVPVAVTVPVTHWGAIRNAWVTSDALRATPGVTQAVINIRSHKMNRMKYAWLHSSLNLSQHNVIQTHPLHYKIMFLIEFPRVKS